jgi:hypothetical protein
MQNVVFWLRFGGVVASRWVGNTGSISGFYISTRASLVVMFWSLALLTNPSRGPTPALHFPKMRHHSSFTQIHRIHVLIGRHNEPFESLRLCFHLACLDAHISERLPFHTLLRSSYPQFCIQERQSWYLTTVSHLPSLHETHFVIS